MNAIVPPPGEAEFRASGTDLSERRRTGLSRGPLVDIAPTPEMTGIAWDANGAARIGASTSIAAIAADARLAAAYHGLAGAAGGLATPQIRHLATLGGNLAQRSRCWYYRNPHFACFKKGGSECPARAGNHLYGVAFDLGPCVAPHPSTLAAALLAYEAKTTTSQRKDLSVEQLLGSGSNGAADHALAPGEIIESVQLAPPLAGERAAYKRAISRAYAEWPLVEVVARVVVERGAFQFVRLAAGGVAPVPLRLNAAEAGRARLACDDRRGGPRHKPRRQALADGGLQARPACRARAGFAGAVLELTRRAVPQAPSGASVSGANPSWPRLTRPSTRRRRLAASRWRARSLMKRLRVDGRHKAGQ